MKNEESKRWNLFAVRRTELRSWERKTVANDLHSCREAARCDMHYFPIYQLFHMTVRPFPDILCPRLRFSVCYGEADKFSSVKNPIELYDRKMRCGNQMLSKTRKSCVSSIVDRSMRTTKKLIIRLIISQKIIDLLNHE